MLAGLGLYGTSWYAVSRRRRELGIRLALGATPAKVRQLVLKRAGVLVSAGVAAGVAGSLWTSSSWLRFCMAWSQSPTVITFAVIILGVVGLLADWIPAVRASQIDPANMLRDS